MSTAKKVKAWGLFCNGRLLNDSGDYCKKKDTPAFALSPRAFARDMIEENGWEVVPCEINYTLPGKKSK